MEARPTYDEKLLRILRESAAIFAAKGYHRASIRDISAATDVSLSGLYYYFKSKEELLFLIQDHCFGTLHHRLDEELEGNTDPVARLRIFVRNHLRFFLSNQAEMKVLSHEADVLTGEHRAAVQKRKRAYAAAAETILTELGPPGGVEPRSATFALFGMMNWIYTWHRPDVDPDADRLAEQMTHLFLHGYRTPIAEGVETLPERSGGGRGDAPSIWRTD
ncbi:MAG: TetR/AcrR family transcriptional regulator [Gemmatimonadales bacterium]|nr:MAG: TetR/AcrR family transcriptional regulator [Gemmatimonadales bacterium]